MPLAVLDGALATHPLVRSGVEYAPNAAYSGYDVVPGRKRAPLSVALDWPRLNVAVYTRIRESVGKPVQSGSAANDTSNVLSEVEVLGGLGGWLPGRGHSARRSRPLRPSARPQSNKEHESAKGGKEPHLRSLHGFLAVRTLVARTMPHDCPNAEFLSPDVIA
jgi:hypothetical protein